MAAWIAGIGSHQSPSAPRYRGPLGHEEQGGNGHALKDVRFVVDTTKQLLKMDIVSQERRTVFEPHRVAIQDSDGAVIDARDDPERSFDGHRLETAWDDLHLAHFGGEALWT
jgi:hypothetical protein